MSKQVHQAPDRCDRDGLSVIELFQMFPDNASARAADKKIVRPDNG